MAITPRYPGLGTKRTATPRNVLKTLDHAVFLPNGVIIDGSQSRDPLNTGDLQYLRAGMLLGKRSANGLYAPSILGVLASAYTGVGTSVLQMTVSAATATELNRRVGSLGTFKLTGPPSAAGTVATTTITYSAVNVTTGVITVTDPDVNAIAGSFVQDTDGSETPLGVVLGRQVGYPIKVTDEDDSDVDVPCEHFLVGGIVDASQIINWPSDTSLIAWVQSKLRDVGYAWCFDNDF